MECLVTKLKASVNDDTLQFLGGIRIKKAQVASATADTQYIQLTSNSTIECIALEGAQFYSSNALTSVVGNKVVGNQGLLTWITNGGKFVIKNKYELKELVLGTIDTISASDLQNLSKIKRIELTGHTTNAIKMNLSDFADTLPSDMEILFIRRCNLTGDISTLSQVALKKLDINAQSVSGDISYLNVSRLESLSIAGTNITGSLESLVAKVINSGKTSGSIVMPYMKSIANVTYQGKLLYSNSNVPASTLTNTLSWTADGTITLT